LQSLKGPSPPALSPEYRGEGEMPTIQRQPARVLSHPEGIF
jgi:hypothetical protein